MAQRAARTNTPSDKSPSGTEGFKRGGVSVKNSRLEPKPIRVRRYKSDGHQMETRIFAREIHESFCCQPKCRYFGKHAQQGVCHTRLRKSVVHDLERRFKQAHELVEEMREISKGWSAAKRIEYLERHIECEWMNYMFTLDECIRLRAMVADLKLKTEL